MNQNFVLLKPSDFGDLVLDGEILEFRTTDRDARHRANILHLELH